MAKNKFPDETAAGRGRNSELRQLFSFQVRRFNILYVRASSLIYQREFGVTLNEWRLLAELYDASESSVPFSQVVRQTSFDVGLASRMVDSLIKKELVLRLVNSTDARVRELSLTAKGRKLAARIVARARSRNERLMSYLSNEDQAALKRIMETLIGGAAEMLEEETKSRHGAKRGRGKSADASE